MGAGELAFSIRARERRKIIRTKNRIIAKKIEMKKHKEVFHDAE